MRRRQKNLVSSLRYQVNMSWTSIDVPVAPSSRNKLLLLVRNEGKFVIMVVYYVSLSVLDERSKTFNGYFTSN